LQESNDERFPAILVTARRLEDWNLMANRVSRGEPPGLLASAQQSRTRSTAFERFRFSFFDDPDSARDGLDTITLAKLEGEERTTAEDMLIRYLPDARAVIGLGVIRSRGAEPRLVELFEAERRAQELAKLAPNTDWSPSLLIYLARALWLIRQDPRWPAAVIEVLASAHHYIHRQAAAQALRDVRNPIAARALTRALDDPDGLVRHHAAQALLAIHDLPFQSNDFEHMAYRLMSDDIARRERGKEDILKAIAERPISAE
jgi:hypothetical protein